MRAIVHMGHPAHVHLFKYLIWSLEEKGHEIVITTLDKDVAIYLLETYNFRYYILGKMVEGLGKKGLNLLRLNSKLFTLAIKFKPDVFISTCSPYAAQVSCLLRRPHIGFGDTETSHLIYKLSLPFSETFCTPCCFKDDYGLKHVRYNGYHELAYLHPNYFSPDPSVIEELGLTPDDVFIILRFISWGASHDVNLKGIDEGAKLDFIHNLESYGLVFITSERKLDEKFERYRITVPPEKMHSLLNYAGLYIGEGGTMAAEAAILGTPAIHVESNSSGIATGNFSGNFLELRDKYELLYFYPDQNQALAKAISILENKNTKKEWQTKKERLLEDKIDVTKWMTDFIERYPESFYEYKSRGEENVF